MHIAICRLLWTLVVIDVSADEKEAQAKEKMKKTLLVMLQDLDDDGSGCRKEQNFAKVSTSHQAYTDACTKNWVGHCDIF